MRRHVPDTLFKAVLAFWLVFGLAAIVLLFLRGRPSLWPVMAVAWGVIVIFVLWVRLSPPRQTRGPLLR